MLVGGGETPRRARAARLMTATAPAATAPASSPYRNGKNGRGTTVHARVAGAPGRQLGRLARSYARHPPTALILARTIALT